MRQSSDFCTIVSKKDLPVRLELQGSTEGFVNLCATWDNERICIACFRNGMYDPITIPKGVADRMGILLDSNGYMLSTTFVFPDL